MFNNPVRDLVNLLLYGGAFIGLCASCITALTFELIGGVEENLQYLLLIGVSTAALYSVHRVIGIRKLRHVITYERYSVIRKYTQHIWLYGFIWTGLSIWLFLPLADLYFLLWLIPGGSIAISYVLPFLSGGRRLRDLGWIKIILIGWSWAWLTAFLPAYYFMHVPLTLSILIGIERLLFIIAITIPFEIRDLNIDKSVGLLTMPSRFGLRRSIMWGRYLCCLVIVISLFLAFHFIMMAYAVSMVLISLITMRILSLSDKVKDDYFFSGVTDGLMILALVFYWFLSVYI